MNLKKIGKANDPDLPASFAAIQRAAKRAYQVALSTNTRLIVVRNGRCVRVKPKLP